MQQVVSSRASGGAISGGLDARLDLIHALVESQAERRPNAVAVVCESERITYADLNARANQIAHRLRAEGVGPEVMVGLYMERSIRTIVAIVGILKAGGCYVPIDLSYPQDRVAYILENSGAKVMITDAERRDSMPEFKGTVLGLDSDYAELGGESLANPTHNVQGSNAAYVIYTSGSTGRPKGVIVTHHNVVRLFTATDHWYRFSDSDVWTVFHSFAFDFSVWEIWGALFYGGTTVVVSYKVSRSPEAFYDLLAREGVTVLNQTPSAFRQLIWAEQNAPKRHQLKLRYVIFGGEALELQSLRPWFDLHPDNAPLLVNMYGITETTVHVTYRPIRVKDLEANLGSVIGEPIPDLTIHLLDEQQNEAAVGAVGEIYVGGEGVARGYLNRPELNAERFILDPFSAAAGQRLYRSGDLARRLPNGDLEYLGRIDHQVKIHGFRIELGEIESVLNSHPALRESAVICDESAGEKRLVAYVVPKNGQPAAHELREFAGRRLPPYMAPARFIFLDSMPLTVNGKVDRKALPAPDTARPELESEFVAPRTEEEKTLAKIWEDVLRVDSVGVKDNFFELGGDSIRSIQVLSRAQEKGIRFSLQRLFQQPTIEQLVAEGEENEDQLEVNRTPFANISERDRSRMPSGVEDAYKIGALQHGMIYHSDLDKKSAIFHDVFSFKLDLPYDRELLEKAVARLVERHTIFRTSFHLNEFSEPLQLVHRDVRVPFTEEDQRGWEKEKQRESLIRWVEAEKRVRFEWTRPPMMRLHVQRYSDKTFQFIVSFHHLIMDGWSLAMMLTELFQDYMGLVMGADEGIEAPRVTYRDFVALEQKTVQAEESRKFWTEKMMDAQIHALPRWPHHPTERYHEQTRGPEIYFPESLLSALQGLARSCGVPIRTVLLAAHCSVIKLLTGMEDIMTGLVTNGRPQCVDGERLIGLFLNTIPFRINVAEGDWRTLIRETFRAEQELIPHRRMPLSEIQQIAGGKSLFETTFDFVQFHIYQDLPGYKDHSFLEDHYFEANNFNFFVTFMLDASAANLQMHYDYNPNDFSKEQIRAICDYYCETLRAMAAAPETSVATTTPIPSDERKKVLGDWNETSARIPDQGVHELIEAQAEARPDAVAVVFENRAITYSELNQRANALAVELQKKGVGPETLVGLYTERSLNLVVGILGIVKAGGAYVPLDPNFPEERIAFMVRDSGIKTIVSTDAMSEKAQRLGEVSVVNLDQAPQKADLRADSAVRSHHLAYVIYTSGSTGQPKGVQITHRALSNFLASMQRQPGITPEDRLLAVTTASFDIAGLEIWLPLISGASVVVASTDAAKDTHALAGLIRDQNITIMQATPVTWTALLDSGWPQVKHLGLKALVGGEAVSRVLADRLIESCMEVWNMYGPTETTIWSTICKLERSEDPISIGKPIANTEIYILDRELNPTPIGSTGEIFIGGEGLARGYLNRAELTAEKFVAHPFKRNARLYRTGDLGYFLPDGNIVCLGRTDNQVKIRGFRIELGEIESALKQHSSIRNAVVSTRESQLGARELICYYTSSGTRVSEEELRRFIGERLPTYMVPTGWMEVADFALTPNGKIDRKKLPEFEARAEAAVECVLPRTPYEIEIADRWKAVLRLSKVGVEDDFFSVGGHSLAAMRLLGGLRTKYNVDVSLASFFEEPTVKALAAHVERLLAAHLEKDLKAVEA
jgi:amino acid adenylation domain-containing protein